MPQAVGKITVGHQSWPTRFPIWPNNLFLKFVEMTNHWMRLQWKHLHWKHLQVCNFIQKRLQHRCFPMINAKFLRTPILKDMQMAASENLSGAAILIFRRYFRSSSLSAFYKGESLFNKLQTFSLKFY